MTAATLLAAALLTVAAVLEPAAASRVVEYRNASAPVHHAIPVTCQSVECVSLVARMTSRMNISANPCEDFYNYACGNFPNIVKYNPQRTGEQMSLTDGDLLFEDTMGLMSEGLEKNIYELLVLDRVATSPDKDISDLFSFTRLFYRSCRQWMYMRSGLNFGSSPRRQEFSASASFLNGVIEHLNETLSALSGGSGLGQVSMETILAAMVKTGGSGILTVSLPRSFVPKVIQEDDFNLTRTARANIDIKAEYLSSDKAEVKEERDAMFRASLDFLASFELGSPLLRFAGRIGNESRPAFLAERQRIVREINNYSKFRSGQCSIPVKNGSSIGEYTVAELDELSACAAAARNGTAFSWRRFFNELLQAQVDPAALVQLQMLQQVKQVTNFVTYMKSRPVFARTGDGSVTFSDDVTFLLFDWLLSFQSFFPREIQSKEMKKLKLKVVDAAEGVSDAATCMLWSKTLLQPILERMYQTAYHRKDFTDVTDLVKLVKEAAIAGVRSQKWITPSAKVAIVKKIQAMRETIGLDELSTAEIKAFYAPTLDEFRAVDLQPKQLHANFGTLFSLALCAYAHKNFDVMSGISPVTLFMEISPLVVNAFNWIQRNQIVFPMAILAPPYYHPSFPAHINLGSLGYVIGHEIGHSFDNIGHLVDQLGAIGHFWDNETEANYLDRMECVRTRYGRYRLYPGGPLHDSNSTLGNDIADIIGIQAATRALKLLQARRPVGGLMPRLPNLHIGISPEQQLFIQAAQSWCVKAEPSSLKRMFGKWPSHSPHHLRVRGIAENSRDFADAFKCRRGQPMNPENKCSFW